MIDTLPYMALPFQAFVTLCGAPCELLNMSSTSTTELRCVLEAVGMCTGEALQQALGILDIIESFCDVTKRSDPNYFF